MSIEAFIARYGVLAIFVGAGLEGETVVVTGGVLAHHGLFPLGAATAAAIAGSFVADQTFFLLGRRFRDHPWVRRLAGKPAFTKALAAFERHPNGFIFVFRFLYGLRTVSPIAIGTTQLAARKFLLVNAAAAIVWGAVFTGIGYVFGRGLQELFGRLLTPELALAATAIGALLVTVTIQTFRRSAGHASSARK